MDSLFGEVERIIELYVKAGESDQLQEKWVKAALLQNLPDKIVTNLSLQLKQAKTIEEMQSLVNVYLHDHKTGMPRGQTGPIICLADQEEQTQTYATIAANANKNANTPNKPEDTKEDPEQRDLDAVKGGKQG